MKQRILELIAQVNGNSDLTLSDDGRSHLVNDLQINSLNLVSLILLIENDLDIEIDFDEFTADHIEKLDNFVAFIDSQASKR